MALNARMVARIFRNYTYFVTKEQSSSFRQGSIQASSGSNSALRSVNTGNSLRAGKRPWHECDYSPPFSAVAENEWVKVKITLSIYWLAQTL